METLQHQRFYFGQFCFCAEAWNLMNFTYLTGNQWIKRNTSGCGCAGSTVQTIRIPPSSAQSLTGTDVSPALFCRAEQSGLDWTSSPAYKVLRNSSLKKRRRHEEVSSAAHGAESWWMVSVCAVADWATCTSPLSPLLMALPILQWALSNMHAS